MDPGKADQLRWRIQRLAGTEHIGALPDRRFVQHDQVNWIGFQEVQRFGNRGGHGDLMAGLPE